ncbi:nucleotidyltransferase domain-containing protein [Kribbella antibiotica]|uniref:Nucleotidyltransferase domain-containing protein n=1 Tax=Kribbella antibiotica TaxID=190195 RepID=A0A4V2YPR3_9ACTN|nr:nucleotidyltransferase domain-containing protein [Kribbella antibiotica]TDD59187.1 nucleotidyltransferase domain-containing protein [Kribbella antibiotica]
MSRDDPIGDATAVVAEFYPQARWALLSGSVLTSSRTTGSDLDIVVLLPDGDPQAPCRESRRFRGWPVELFVYDEKSLDHYLAELPSRRPVLTRMVATGVQLMGDAAHADRLQARCAQVLAAGPAALTDAERDALRYKLTDLLDDLTHTADPGERTVIATTAWTVAAEQALAFNRRWTGGGKWLLRELRALDPELAERWLSAHGDPAAIADFSQHVLDQAGGPLFAGYRAAGSAGSR